MSHLVFDIETAALPLESFDDVQQEYLLREANKIEDPAARQMKSEDLQRQFSLYPFTARIACIAMLNAESGKGKVLYTADDFEEETSSPIAEFTPCMDESEMIAEFWSIASKFDSVVTFNGRGFDVPFLYLRSAILNVPISRKDWLGYRYQIEPHCDLAEQLTFYCVSGRDGASRKFNLDFYCKSFGIESPKSAGISGMDVTNLMAAGCHRAIAEYCLRDVVATAQLYQIWRERLSGIK
ncbi:MAG TPA: ribonuclease H-like domain-containing protein [Methylomirabilota bacterium]|nr:ribonuclease H-like domain-containing protein [Methylomirabilota bacterium]